MPNENKSERNKSERGFAAMDEEKQREIAPQGWPKRSG
jgi:hypothetical protein